MSGMQQAMMAAGARVSFAIGTVADFRAAPTAASASVSFTTAGLINYTGNASTGSAGWITPASAVVGNNYWIRLTVNSGSAPTGGSAVATVLSLSGAQSWVWAATSGTTRVSNATITVFADAAGTIPLASSTFSVDVESSP